jgi:hypothetical protein
MNTTVLNMFEIVGGIGLGLSMIILGLGAFSLLAAVMTAKKNISGIVRFILVSNGIVFI